MFKKLRRRFVLFTMSLLTLVFAALFVTIYLSTEFNARQQMALSLRESMEKSDHHNAENPLLAATINIRLNEEDDEIEGVSSLTEVDDDALETTVDDILSRDDSEGFISMGGSRYAYMFWPGIDHNNLALVSSAQYDQTMNNMLITFLITGVGALGLLFLLSLLFSEKAIKPVRQAFNKQKQFVADASHELKTPLTIIGTNLDLIASNSGETVESQRKWLSYIEDQKTRMTQLVNDLLNLARLDDPSLKITLTQTDISALLKRTLLYYEVPFYEKNIDVTVKIAEKAQLHADAPAFERLTGILLDNALKYTPTGGKVSVTLAQDKAKIHLCVSNTHEKLEQDQVDRFFDRFYRLSSSRSQQNPGYGLGLAIARTIAEQHNGKITARLNGEWIDFIVDLPIK